MEERALMGIKSLYRDPYAGKYFKIFLVSFICWMVIGGLNFTQTLEEANKMKVTLRFFGFPVYSMTSTIFDYYSISTYWQMILSVPKTILMAITIISLALALLIYAIPDIKKKWESIYKS